MFELLQLNKAALAIAFICSLTFFHCTPSTSNTISSIPSLYLDSLTSGQFFAPFSASHLNFTSNDLSPFSSSMSPKASKSITTFELQTAAFFSKAHLSFLHQHHHQIPDSLINLSETKQPSHIDQHNKNISSTSMNALPPQLSSQPNQYEVSQPWCIYIPHIDLPTLVPKSTSALQLPPLPSYLDTSLENTPFEDWFDFTDGNGQIFDLQDELNHDEINLRDVLTKKNLLRQFGTHFSSLSGDSDDDGDDPLDMNNDMLNYEDTKPIRKEENSLTHRFSTWYDATIDQLSSSSSSLFSKPFQNTKTGGVGNGTGNKTLNNFSSTGKKAYKPKFARPMHCLSPSEFLITQMSLDQQQQIAPLYFPPTLRSKFGNNNVAMSDSSSSSHSTSASSIRPSLFSQSNSKLQSQLTTPSLPPSSLINPDNPHLKTFSYFFPQQSLHQLSSLYYSPISGAVIQPLSTYLLQTSSDSIDSRSKNSNTQQNILESFFFPRLHQTPPKITSFVSNQICSFYQGANAQRFHWLWRMLSLYSAPTTPPSISHTSTSQQDVDDMDTNETQQSVDNNDENNKNISSQHFSPPNLSPFEQSTQLSNYLFESPSKEVRNEPKVSNLYDRTTSQLLSYHSKHYSHSRPRLSINTSDSINNHIISPTEPQSSPVSASSLFGHATQLRSSLSALFFPLISSFYSTPLFDELKTTMVNTLQNFTNGPQFIHISFPTLNPNELSSMYNFFQSINEIKAVHIVLLPIIYTLKGFHKIATLEPIDLPAITQFTEITTLLHDLFYTAPTELYATTFDSFLTEFTTDITSPTNTTNTTAFHQSLTSLTTFPMSFTRVFAQISPASTSHIIFYIIFLFFKTIILIVLPLFGYFSNFFYDPDRIAHKANLFSASPTSRPLQSNIDIISPTFILWLTCVLIYIFNYNLERSSIWALSTIFNPAAKKSRSSKKIQTALNFSRATRRHLNNLQDKLSQEKFSVLQSLESAIFSLPLSSLQPSAISEISPDDLQNNTLIKRDDVKNIASNTDDSVTIPFLRNNDESMTSSPDHPPSEVLLQNPPQLHHHSPSHHFQNYHSSPSQYSVSFGLHKSPSQLSILSNATHNISTTSTYHPHHQHQYHPYEFYLDPNSTEYAESINPLASQHLHCVQSHPNNPSKLAIRRPQTNADIQTLCYQYSTPGLNTYYAKFAPIYPPFYHQGTVPLFLPMVGWYSVLELKQTVVDLFIEYKLMSGRRERRNDLGFNINMYNNYNDTMKKIVYSKLTQLFSHYSAIKQQLCADFQLIQSDLLSLVTRLTVAQSHQSQNFFHKMTDLRFQDQDNQTDLDPEVFSNKLRASLPSSVFSSGQRLTGTNIYLLIGYFVELYINMIKTAGVIDKPAFYHSISLLPHFFIDHQQFFQFMVMNPPKPTTALSDKNSWFHNFSPTNSSSSTPSVSHNNVINSPLQHPILQKQSSYTNSIMPSHSSPLHHIAGKIPSPFSIISNTSPYSSLPHSQSQLPMYYLAPPETHNATIGSLTIDPHYNENTADSSSSSSSSATFNSKPITGFKFNHFFSLHLATQHYLTTLLHQQQSYPRPFDSSSHNNDSNMYNLPTTPTDSLLETTLLSSTTSLPLLSTHLTTYFSHKLTLINYIFINDTINLFQNSGITDGVSFVLKNGFAPNFQSQLLSIPINSTDYFRNTVYNSHQCPQYPKLPSQQETMLVDLASIQHNVLNQLPISSLPSQIQDKNASKTKTTLSTDLNTNTSTNGTQSKSIKDFAHGYRKFNSQDNFWFDLMADTGDGGDPTYNIARLLATPYLDLPLPAPPSDQTTSPNKPDSNSNSLNNTSTSSQTSPTTDVPDNFNMEIESRSFANNPHIRRVRKVINFITFFWWNRAVSWAQTCKSTYNSIYSTIQRYNDSINNGQVVNYNHQIENPKKVQDNIGQLLLDNSSDLLILHPHYSALDVISPLISQPGQSYDDVNDPSHTINIIGNTSNQTPPNNTAHVPIDDILSLQQSQHTINSSDLQCPYCLYEKFVTKKFNYLSATLRKRLTKLEKRLTQTTFTQKLSPSPVHIQSNQIDTTKSPQLPLSPVYSISPESMNLPSFECDTAIRTDPLNTSPKEIFSYAQYNKLPSHTTTNIITPQTTLHHPERIHGRKLSSSQLNYAVSSNLINVESSDVSQANIIGNHSAQTHTTRPNSSEMQSSGSKASKKPSSLRKKDNRKENISKDSNSTKNGLSCEKFKVTFDDSILHFDPSSSSSSPHLSYSSIEDNDSSHANNGFNKNHIDDNKNNNSTNHLFSLELSPTNIATSTYNPTNDSGFNTSHIINSTQNLPTNVANLHSLTSPFAFSTMSPTITPTITVIDGSSRQQYHLQQSAQQPVSHNFTLPTIFSPPNADYQSSPDQFHSFLKQPSQSIPFSTSLPIQLIQPFQPIQPLSTSLDYTIPSIKHLNASDLAQVTYTITLPTDPNNNTEEPITIPIAFPTRHIPSDDGLPTHYSSYKEYLLSSATRQSSRDSKYTQINGNRSFVKPQLDCPHRNPFTPFTTGSYLSALSNNRDKLFHAINNIKTILSRSSNHTQPIASPLPSPPTSPSLNSPFDFDDYNNQIPTSPADIGSSDDEDNNNIDALKLTQQTNSTDQSNPRNAETMINFSDFRLRTPRGKVLFILGDLVYPTPSVEAFEGRLWYPFSQALPPPFLARHNFAHRVETTPINANEASANHRAISKQQIINSISKVLPHGGFGSQTALPVPILPQIPSGSTVYCDDPGNATQKPAIPTGMKLGDYQGVMMYQLAGNHDCLNWEEYVRFFIQRHYLGGWLMPQTRSYFSVEFPHNIWIFGADIGLTNDLDFQQLSYFANIVKHLPDNARVIMCQHEPTWLTGPYSGHYENSSLVQLLTLLGDKCVIRIGGDVHNYIRHSKVPFLPPSQNSSFGQNINHPMKSDSNTVIQSQSQPQHLIVSGGGGAFTHPPFPFANPLFYHNRLIYDYMTSFPTCEQAYTMVWQNISKFRRNNWKIDLIGFIIYFLIIVSLLPICNVSDYLFAYPLRSNYRTVSAMYQQSPATNIAGAFYEEAKLFQKCTPYSLYSVSNEVLSHSSFNNCTPHSSRSQHGSSFISPSPHDSFESKKIPSSSDPASKLTQTSVILSPYDTHGLPRTFAGTIGSQCVGFSTCDSYYVPPTSQSFSSSFLSAQSASNLYTTSQIHDKEAYCESFDAFLDWLSTQTHNAQNPTDSSPQNSTNTSFQNSTNHSSKNSTFHTQQHTLNYFSQQYLSTCFTTTSLLASRFKPLQHIPQTGFEHTEGRLCTASQLQHLSINVVPYTASFSQQPSFSSSQSMQSLSQQFSPQIQQPQSQAPPQYDNIPQTPYHTKHPAILMKWIADTLPAPIYYFAILVIRHATLVSQLFFSSMLNLHFSFFFIVIFFFGIISLVNGHIYPPKRILIGGAHALAHILTAIILAIWIQSVIEIGTTHGLIGPNHLISQIHQHISTFNQYIQHRNQFESMSHATQHNSTFRSQQGILYEVGLDFDEFLTSHQTDPESIKIHLNSTPVSPHTQVQDDKFSHLLQQTISSPHPTLPPPILELNYNTLFALERTAFDTISSILPPSIVASHLNILPHLLPQHNQHTHLNQQSGLHSQTIHDNAHPLNTSPQIKRNLYKLSSLLVNFVDTLLHSPTSYPLLLPLPLPHKTKNRPMSVTPLYRPYADSIFSLYNIYSDFEKEQFPDTNNLKGTLEQWTFGLYPAFIKAWMLIFDFSHLHAFLHTRKCQEKCMPTIVRSFPSFPSQHNNNHHKSTFSTSIFEQLDHHIDTSMATSPYPADTYVEKVYVETLLNLITTRHKLLLLASHTLFSPADQPQNRQTTSSTTPSSSIRSNNGHVHIFSPSSLRSALNLTSQSSKQNFFIPVRDHAPLSNLMSSLYYISFFVFFFFLATPMFALILSIYLTVGVYFFNINWDEGFSSLRSPAYKHFCRFRIDSLGVLHCYVLGIERTPKKWKQDEHWSYDILQQKYYQFVSSYTASLATTDALLQLEHQKQIQLIQQYHQDKHDISYFQAIHDDIDQSTTKFKQCQPKSILPTSNNDDISFTSSSSSSSSSSYLPASSSSSSQFYRTAPLPTTASSEFELAQSQSFEDRRAILHDLLSLYNEVVEAYQHLHQSTTHQRPSRWQPVETDHVSIIDYFTIGTTQNSHNDLNRT